MYIRRLLFFIICSTKIIFCSAQHNENEKQLNMQLSSFEVRFQKLMLMRGGGGSDNDYRSGKVDADILQTALSHYVDVSIIFYHYEAGQLFTWLISKDQIISHSTATTPEELEKLEQDLKLQIGVKTQAAGVKLIASRGAAVENANAAGNVQMGYLQKRLSEILFPASIASVINDTTSIKHLIVVPELNIATIPFYYLQPFNDSSYVVDHASISVAHSFNDLLNRIYYYCETKKWCQLGNVIAARFTPDDPLVVGNPDFSGCANVFQQLAGSGQEADYAAAQLNIRPLKGKEASKKNVLAKVHGSEFIYLATHGMSSSDDPLNNSYLVFAGDSGCEHWTAREIQSDELKKEAIVVLSACQTGLGRTHEGGVIGLSRAFIMAGAMNVIMSLWSVRDEATKELMAEFMNELKQPHVFFPADNLRQAIVNYKKKNPDPAAWACFTMMGTPFPVNLKMNIESKSK